MKKIIFSMIAAMMSLAAMAQSNIWYWKSGTPIKVASVDSVTFTPPTNITYEYVDLGLSVKWATCNVGANAPTEYGDYFAWGETTPKTEYSWATYIYITEDYDYIKYSKNDGKYLLDAEDDAAIANWGGAWRMPTGDEQHELLEDCTWEWQAEGNASFNGVAGMKVTSKKAGYTDKYIFLPAAGNLDGSTLNASFSIYWSATRASGAENGGYIGFNSGFLGWRNGAGRYQGCSVRPVCP